MRRVSVCLRVLVDGSLICAYVCDVSRWRHRNSIRKGLHDALAVPDGRLLASFALGTRVRARGAPAVCSARGGQMLSKRGVCRQGAVVV